jgi:hypothetical protein
MPARTHINSRTYFRTTQDSARRRALERICFARSRISSVTLSSLATAYERQANRELALKAANVVLNLPQDSVTDENLAEGFTSRQALGKCAGYITVKNLLQNYSGLGKALQPTSGKRIASLPSRRPTWCSICLRIASRTRCAESASPVRASRP